MTKKVISIVSVLKPIDDTRNYEKIASSIGNTNKYDINIIGFSVKKTPDQPNISFYPIFNFKRISLQRIIAPIKLFRILIKLKPELIIVTCPEILSVITFYKIIFGCKIIYDIQENYFRNIMYSGAYPGLLKYPLAGVVRLNELICKPYINGFMLAESIYDQQMNLPRDKTIVIDNKAYIPESLENSKNKKSNLIKLIYSGTIAQHYGIFDAIDFVDCLIEHEENVHFTIVGHTHQSNIYKKLLKCIEGKSYITLKGGTVLAPHDQILMALKDADFCLLPYQENKSTAGRIPTKLFECLAMEVPMIINSNPTINPYITKNNAGIIYDFQSKFCFDVNDLKKTYYGINAAEKYKWNTNIDKLISFVNRIIN